MDALEPLTIPGSHFIGRFGLRADLRASQGFIDIHQRRYLFDIQRIFRNETLGVWMVETRHFNGEMGPTVALNQIHVFQREPLLTVKK